MLTATDQRPTSAQPVLRQSDVELELMPADGSSALPLSLLLGAPSSRALGDETRPS